GATGDNALLDERVVANVEEFSRRFAYPRLVAARPEDFFREVERRWGAKLPVRRGDTGCYRGDGAASTAAELGRYRAAQLAARAAELLALGDGNTEPPGGGAGGRRDVSNASSWARSDMGRLPNSVERRLVRGGREWPTVDLPDCSALVVARGVPELGHLTFTESERAANPPRGEGARLEAQ